MAEMRRAGQGRDKPRQGAAKRTLEAPGALNLVTLMLADKQSRVLQGGERLYGDQH